MRACEILPRILIDNLHCFKQTWNSNVDAYHGKCMAFMPSSVLELLPNFKSTYFASMNPPNISTACILMGFIVGCFLLKAVCFVILYSRRLSEVSNK